jgi:hypothetical protein
MCYFPFSREVAVRSPNELTELGTGGRVAADARGRPHSQRVGFTVTHDLKHLLEKTQAESKTPGVHIAHPALAVD